MFQELRASFVLFFMLTLLVGVGYPLLTLDIGQTLFPHQANGSLIEDQGKIIGSELIGQNFNGDAYFHPRPSAAGSGYDAANSSGSNMGPTSMELINAVGERAAVLKQSNPTPIPVDLVTASASGLDPDISPASAQFQIARIASARHLELIKIDELIARHTTPRTLGLFGEPRVNVLEINRALDDLTKLDLH